MKTITAHAAKDLRIEDHDVPTPGPGEVLVRMDRGGICGSDLHYYNHGGFGTVRLKEPMILGHEVSGRIEALGDGIDGLCVGQLVAVSPSRPCGACGFCQGGQQNHCENMRFYGSAMPFPHIQGAFRELLVADASQCVASDKLSPAEAAMAEPLAVVLHAAGHGGSLAGKRVLVTGCGPIGLLATLVARTYGAIEVLATDVAEFTLKKARDVGADATINVADAPDGLAPFAKGKGFFDVLFECSGVEAALRSAIPALRPGGTILQLGLGGDMTLPVQAMTAKELSLKGSLRFHHEFSRAVEHMQKKRIDVLPLVTHSFAMQEAVRAFEIAGDRGQSVKVQLEFGC